MEDENDRCRRLPRMEGASVATMDVREEYIDDPVSYFDSRCEWQDGEGNHGSTMSHGMGGPRRACQDVVYLQRLGFNGSTW